MPAAVPPDPTSAGLKPQAATERDRGTDTAEDAWTPQRFRAPSENGRILMSVPLAAACRSARETHDRLAAERLDLQGRTLEHLRAWAREGCLRAAADYTSQITGERREVPDASQLVFAGGHQPALFHPGVWVKNFVLGRMADRASGTGLNLIVDNDTVSSRAVKIPGGAPGRPAAAWLPYDVPCPSQPWEDATIADLKLFRSFGERAVAHMSNWQVRPVVAEMWPVAVRYSEESGSLSDCLTAARQSAERRFGLENLELPLSRMCRQPAFLWFASHLLAHLPRFREIHNEVLWQYRKVNRIRSRSHPVPELAELDGWLEAPFWMWREGQQHRSRVFARQTGNELQLSDGADVFATLRLTPEMDACCAVEGLEQLPAQGVRFRTRALTTTLFARLCLSDLFVHGIGGAKYDEMTDRIIHRFFGIEPPRFLMATATLHLPVGKTYPVAQHDARELRRKLRDARFNPERHVVDGDVTDLVRRKHALIERQESARVDDLSFRQRRLRRTKNRARYLEFREINEQLAAHGEDYRARLAAQLREVEDKLAANRVLQDREYSYALYPEETLRSLIESLTQGRAL